MQTIEIKMGDVRAEITPLHPMYQVEVWRESLGRENSITRGYGTQTGCFLWVLKWAESTSD
jgi:hypothetical protein